MPLTIGGSSHPINPEHPDLFEGLVVNKVKSLKKLWGNDLAIFQVDSNLNDENISDANKYITYMNLGFNNGAFTHFSAASENMFYYIVDILESDLRSKKQSNHSVPEGTSSKILYKWCRAHFAPDKQWKGYCPYHHIARITYLISLFLQEPQLSKSTVNLLVDCDKKLLKLGNLFNKNINKFPEPFSYFETSADLIASICEEGVKCGKLVEENMLAVTVGLSNIMPKPDKA